MTIFPGNPRLRRIAWFWLAAAMLAGTAMLLRPALYDENRSALAALLPLYFMAFPLGHLGLLACNALKLQLYLHLQLVPGMAGEGVLLWLLLTALGYVQWFVLLPAIARGLSILIRRRVNRN